MRGIEFVVTGLVLALAGTIVADAVSAEPSQGALPPYVIDTVPVAGLAGVPADAEMVVATVTVVEPAGPGWLVLFPCDDDPPTAANLNYAAGAITNNLALVRIDTDGAICVATRSVTDYTVDAVGYVPAGAGLTALPTATRVLDTRDGTGGPNPSPVPHGTTVALDVAGVGGVPGDATLAVFNLTAVGWTERGRITVHPCDEPPGTTSSVNFPGGGNVANLIISRLAADGTVCLAATNASDMVVDVTAWAADADDVTSLPAPRRVLDTRADAGLLTAGTVTTIDIGAQPGASTDPSAAVYNLAAIDGVGQGRLVAYPCDEATPETATRNFLDDQPVSVTAFTALSADGTLCVLNTAPVEIAVDLVATTGSEGTIVALTPARLVDTRERGLPTCGWLIAASPYRRASEDGPNGSMRAANLSTSETFSVEQPDHPDGFDGFPLRPVIDRDCTGFVYLAPDLTLHRYGFDGTASSAPVPIDPGASDPVEFGDFDSIQHLDDGTIVGVGPRLVDLETGADIGAGVGGPARLSRSGTVLATVLQGEIRTFTRSGERIGSYPVGFPPRAGVVSLSLSPDGRYVAYDRPTFEFGGFAAVIMSLGEPVTVGVSADVDDSVWSVMTGDGTIATCDVWNGNSRGTIVEWYVFGDVLRRTDVECNPGIGF